MTVIQLLKLMEAYDLEPSQAMYAYLLYEAEFSELTKYCAMVKDRKEIVPRIVAGKRKMVSKKSRLTLEEAQDMVSKKVINPKYTEDEEFNLIDASATEDFRDWMDKLLGKKDYGLANEFWEAYPMSNQSNGKVIPLKAVDMDGFKDLYAKKISPAMHAKFMQILAQKRMSVNVRIDSFVFGKDGSEPQWKAFADQANPSLGASNVKL